MSTLPSGLTRKQRRNLFRTSSHSPIGGQHLHVLDIAYLITGRLQTDEHVEQLIDEARDLSRDRSTGFGVRPLKMKEMR